MNPAGPHRTISATGSARTDYSRLTGTIFDPRRFGAMSATVVGAGALGNEVCRILGLLGAARVLVIDPDTVEPANLTRSVLFRLRDFTGRNKAEALAEASTAIFPDTKWDHLPVAMADAGLLRLSDSNIVFSCVDSDLARIEIAVCALKLNKTVVDGGLGPDGDSWGRITVYAGREHACYACQLMPQVRARLLAEHFQKRYSCTAEPVLPAPIPGTPALASVVGSLQVDRAIRYLAQPETERASRAIELRLDDDASLMALRVNRDPACPFHSVEGIQVPVLSAETTFMQILEQAGVDDGAVVLDWPVCALARCRTCGRDWAPMRRLGLVRNGAGCPRCGEHNWIALETISEVGAASPYAGEPVTVFGLSGEHLFTAISNAGSY